MWIALIEDEVDRVERCESLILQARNKDVEIWTSSLTVAEVYKFKCGDDSKEMTAEKDEAFERYLQQDFVFQVQLDHDVAVTARRLLRNHPPLKKPSDGVHLATAVLNNLDVLYTFDHKNLIPLNRLVQRTDGQMLSISEPPPPVIGVQQGIFDRPTS